MALLPAIDAKHDKIRIESNNYAHLTDIFGILRQETKDLERTVVHVFSIEVDTNLFTGRFLLDKIYNIYELIKTALNKWSMMLFEA